MSPSSRRVICVVVFAALSATSTFAQKPSIGSIAPLAVTPGVQQEIEIRGGNLENTRAIWTNFPAEHSFVPDKSAKDKAVFRMSAKKTVPPGIYALRVATDKGISGLRIFCVDDLTTVKSVGKNLTQTAAQQIDLPIAVDGIVQPQTRQYFRFAANKDQRLSFEVLGRRIGSALDPLLRLLDERGRELTYSDDAPGLSHDARISHTFKADGHYILELRDIRFQGGGNHFFRLRLGDFPCVNMPYPIAAQRGSSVELSYAGHELAGTLPGPINVPADFNAAWLPLAARRDGNSISGFSAPLLVQNVAQVVEAEPNDKREQATPWEIGSASINGILQTRGDVDCFQFSAQKDQEFVFTSVTRQNGSAADLILQLFNSAGQRVAKADDFEGSEARFAFKFPADGIFTLAVSELSQRGGPEFAYHISAEPKRAGFRLVASADRLNVPAGGCAAITVTAKRDGYTGPVRLQVDGLPTGMKCRSACIGAGQSSVVMTVTSEQSTPLGAISPARIIGLGDGDTKAIANLSAVIQAAHQTLPWVPAMLDEEFAVGVAPRAPFTPKTNAEEIEFGQHLAAPVKVTVERGAGIDEAIALTVNPPKNGLPPGVSAELKPIAKGSNEIEIVFRANEKAPLGDFTAVLNATHKKGKATVTQVVPGIGLKISPPFEISAKAAAFQIAVTGETQLPLKVRRNPAYAGTVLLKVEGLPANVACEPVTLAADKNDATLVLKSTGAKAASSKLTIVAEGKFGDKPLSVKQAIGELKIE